MNSESNKIAAINSSESLIRATKTFAYLDDFEDDDEGWDDDPEPYMEDGISDEELIEDFDDDDIEYVDIEDVEDADGIEYIDIDSMDDIEDAEDNSKA